MTILFKPVSIELIFPLITLKEKILKKSGPANLPRALMLLLPLMEIFDSPSQYVGEDITASSTSGNSPFSASASGVDVPSVVLMPAAV